MSRHSAAPFNKTLSRWMTGGGPCEDVVVSTRVRLARNLAQYPFPPSARREDALAVRGAVQRSLDDLPDGGDYEFYPLDRVEEIDRWVLVEKHLASPQLVGRADCTAIILDAEESISVMVNEEDHLRIQCLVPGFDLESAWSLADTVDDSLGAGLEYAFDEDFGYLTACPSNVGTGFRGSVMAHLPGLVHTGQIEPLMSGLNKAGALVRGVFGEGSKAEGNLFQVSNRISLGSSEDEMAANLAGVARELMSRERSAREALLNGNRYELEDRVYRAYGLLTNARKMSSEEALDLLSMLRLGSDINILPGGLGDAFPELLVRIRRASLQRVVGERLDTNQRDIRRATLVRNRLLNDG